MSDPIPRPARITCVSAEGFHPPATPDATAAVRVGRGVAPSGDDRAAGTSMTVVPATAHPRQALSRLAALVALPAEEGSDQVVAALTAVCDLIPGAPWATLSAGDDAGVARTVHATHSRARAADELQFQLREGPTLDVIRGRQPVLADTVSSDPRWPRFAPLITAQSPVVGILSVPVDAVGNTFGALTLYGGADHDFGDEATAVTVAMAATALAGLAQRERAATLHRALLSNRRIGVAVGILMALHHWTEQHALHALHAASQATNRIVSDVAEEITRTRALPTAN